MVLGWPSSLGRPGISSQKCLKITPWKIPSACRNSHSNYYHIIYIYIFIGLIQNIWVHIWCLTSRGNASYVLKKSLPYIDKLDICESLQHLKAWRFPEPFLCGGSRRVPASLVFDYPSVAELVDRGRVGMILLAIGDYTTWFIYWGLW